MHRRAAARKAGSCRARASRRRWLRSRHAHLLLVCKSHALLSCALWGRMPDPRVYHSCCAMLRYPREGQLLCCALMAAHCSSVCHRFPSVSLRRLPFQSTLRLCSVAMLGWRGGTLPARAETHGLHTSVAACPQDIRTRWSDTMTLPFKVITRQGSEERRLMNDAR